MQRQAVWKGTDADLERLKHATAEHCQCEDGKPTCPAHQMLSSQRVLDGLIFVRAQRRAYLRKEFTQEPHDG
jgi:hypothetical protein